MKLVSSWPAAGVKWPPNVEIATSGPGYNFQDKKISWRELLDIHYARSAATLITTIPNPAKEASIAGVLVSPDTNGATNWPPPSYSPLTKLFYLNATEGYSVAYLYDTSREPQGYGGGSTGQFDPASSLIAMDVTNGKVKWKHIARGEGAEGGGMSGGILTTAGNLLFTGDSDRLTAFDPADGKILWSQKLDGHVSNGPSTWTLNGRQNVIVGVDDSLYALTLDGK